MEAIAVSLILIALVVASSILAKMSPVALPIPFVQIFLGAAAAFAFDFRVQLDPPTFLLLLAPLLFLDGWRTPKEGLLHDKGTIAALAFGLVFFTVLGAGYFIHWMIPTMPLAVAFALASAISPTDAVAVSAIVSRVPVAKRLIHILEGESLLNDASGLVCMRFAIAAAATGTFSILEASITFIWIATIGVFVGVAVALLATTAKDWVSRRFGEETGSQILISLLIPFAAYMLAERADASGILAAVAAGVVMGWEERSGRALPITRLQRAAVWDALQFAGNGAIFVVLGQQLPAIVTGASEAVQETGHFGTFWLAVYVVAVSLALLFLRAAWAWVTLRILLFREKTADSDFAAPNWRLVAATSLAGVRGAVTLAGAFALPITLDDGSPFPSRDLVIFLAAGVIVLSLVLANVGLPRVMNVVTLSPRPLLDQDEVRARAAATQAAISAVEQRLSELSKNPGSAERHADAAARVLALYRQRLGSRTDAADVADPDIREIERELHLAAIRAERAEIYNAARSKRLPEELASRLIREADLIESRFSLS
ncbi:Na+/H+ antiporter [Rhizobium sp. S152]|uniref:Na+/H+ antiporter n=1 Tax=Rhizobium sp. S152 TaxID=3055038 RepID=UPI0025A9C471|nr:Na+/H+ antiporter [Rhizobium sp. S152]MDM9627804.1 Na+/H+ antiporter [Rhizobium sp. S152]